MLVLTPWGEVMFSPWRRSPWRLVSPPYGFRIEELLAAEPWAGPLLVTETLRSAAPERATLRDALWDAWADAVWAPRSRSPTRGRAGAGREPGPDFGPA